MASLSLVLARFPGLVEQVYGAGVGPRIARALSLATGWFPVSVSWLLFLGLGAWAGVRSARAVARIRRGELGWGSAFKGGGIRLAGVVGLLLLVFYLFWGLNYARAPIDQRLGLVTAAPLDVKELRDLTAHAMERTNPSPGRPT